MLLSLNINFRDFLVTINNTMKSIFHCNFFISCLTQFLDLGNEIILDKDRNTLKLKVIKAAQKTRVGQGNQSLRGVIESKLKQFCQHQDDMEEM